jgi:tetratricopeptide (TPR) repeat protein
MEKKKKIVAFYILSLLLASYSSLFAQNPADIYLNPKYGPDSASRQKCANDLSTMSEFMKIDLLDYAHPSWLAVFKECPAASKNIYLHGVKIYRYKLDKETDPVRKKELLDTLMLIYDKRIENFGQEGLVLGLKGRDLLKYDPTSVEEVHKILGRSVQLAKNNSEESVVLTYMQTTVAMFKAQKITTQEVIDNYLLSTEILDNIIKTGTEPEKAQIAMANVEARFAESGAASCDDLIKIFTPNFNADPGNVDLLKKITSLLNNRGCEGSDLFADASEKLYTLEPSAKAAFNLSKLFIKREAYEKSLDYYQKAIDAAESPEDKAQYCYQKAVLLLNRFEKYAESRNYALQAIALRGNWGDPYILIGNAYAASTKVCGENDFEKTTVYWVAVDKFLKAKSVDESVKDNANELINRYSQYFPNVEEAFFNGYQEGQQYTVGCWINETTTVRTRK